jgi:lysophospholipase L1-like esterase
VRPAAPVLLVLLVVLSACDTLKSLTSPTPPATPAGAVRYTAMGASDAIGYGGSVVCFPFSPCPDGTGYVQTVTRRLQAQHTDFGATNLGIPGAVVSRRIQDLAAQTGSTILANYTDGQAPFVPRDSTLVTIFAGGNDANAVGTAARTSAAGGNVEAFLTTQITAFDQDFRALLAAIRARAPNATVVVLNLPNLSRLPYVADLSSTERDWLRRLSVGFSAAMNATRDTQVRVVDLMCNAALYAADIYSSDGFHPNDRVYALLADLVSAAVAAAPAAPAASCGLMN